MESANPYLPLILGLLLVSFLTALLSQFLNPNKYSMQFSGLLYEQPVTDGRYKSIKVNGKRVYMPRYFDLDQGDYVDLDFASCEYNSKYDSYDNCRILVDHNKESWFLRQVLVLRVTIIGHAKTRLPSPHDVLVLAMTIGYKNDLPDSLTEKLREIGAIHMLVVSGYNVSLVLNSSGVLLMRFPRWIYLVFSMFLLVLFALLTGFDAPIVRSVVMGTFVVVGKAYSRPSAALYLLILSAVVMVSWNLEYLSNISFQLSFAATFGVIISGYFFKFQNNLLSDLFASFGASLFVLPIVSFYFGTISFLGVISSILLGWLVPSITYLGFLVYLFNLKFLNFLLVIIVDVFLKIADLIGYFSFLNVQYQLTSKDLVFYYIVLGMVVLLAHNIKRGFIDE